MTIINKALVENGVVSNIAVFDTDNLPSWANSWVDVDDTVSVGFLHDGTSFTDPTPALTDEELSSIARKKRDKLLLNSDWRASSDVTLSSQWRTYRQSLRDIPAQSGFPESVTWPTEPS